VKGQSATQRLLLAYSGVGCRIDNLKSQWYANMPPWPRHGLMLQDKEFVYLLDAMLDDAEQLTRYLRALRKSMGAALR